MANTITLVSSQRAREQFQGAFSGEMYRVRATIDDQDAVAATDSVLFPLTVTGLALGDIVVGFSLSVDQSDGTDNAVVQCYVSAANTLTVHVQADVAEFAADALNAAIVRALVVKPNW